MSPVTYIGIDSIPGSPPFCLAALDVDRRLVALSAGPLAEMVAYASGQSEAVVAVCAPPGPNLGLAERQESLPLIETAPLRSREHDLRLAELLLRNQGFAVPRTLADPSHCQGWMRRGFILHENLHSAGYEAYPCEGPRAWLETEPDACFQALMGVVPFRRGTLEGRLQRQLVLHDLRLPVPDAMEFFEEVTRYKLLHGVLPAEEIHPQRELNALMAAHVAWLAACKPLALSAFGDPQEGVIYLPKPSEQTLD